jgi:RHS repeat-associated protein
VRYAGYYFDYQTSLYKVGQRYYDPALGRWTQPDPLDQPLDQRGWNPYTYAGNDPIDFTDPSGTCIFFCDPVSQWVWSHRGDVARAIAKLSVTVDAAWTCGVWGVRAARVAMVTANPEVVAAAGAVGCALAVGAKLGLQNYFKIAWNR